MEANLPCGIFFTAATSEWNIWDKLDQLGWTGCFIIASHHEAIVSLDFS